MSSLYMNVGNNIIALKCIYFKIKIKKRRSTERLLIWCRRWDLNPHGVTRLILSQVRLPFRHSGVFRNNDYYTQTLQSCQQIFYKKFSNFKNKFGNLCLFLITCIFYEQFTLLFSNLLYNKRYFCINRKETKKYDIKVKF